MKMKFASLIIALALVFNTLSFAQELTPVEPKKVTITQEKLDELLFAGSPDLLHLMNNINKAKDQLNIARGELLPSLNIGAVISFSNPATFLLNSVSCLVPFIFPGKWFDLKTTKRTYNAEVMGYHIAKLNIYASAYALATRVSGDIATLKIAKAELDRFKSYFEEMKKQVGGGYVKEIDLVTAEIELAQKESNYSKMSQTVDNEIATLRKAFGLSLDTEIEVKIGHIAKPSLEGKNPVKEIDTIIENAPEKEQLELMAIAAKASIRSAQWAFLSGCSGNQGNLGSAQGSSSFNFSTGANVSLGFGYFSRIKLARRNATEVELRKQDLALELARSVESAINDADGAQFRVTQYEMIKIKTEELLRDTQRSYALGLSTLRDVLDAFDRLARANIESITATSELDGHRITLKRIAMDPQFKNTIDESRESFVGKKKL